ncbi:RNA polymerase sigma-70 factor, ECF subfamily [Geodermatophilus pulveris]|uniref:RNA polymerase sigma-70 factor, ECF subfamily n=1 Tax=Geodermatophilus pulveris TaxID=1564159 RepID=A0A239DW09_9ACTN|nr:sigma-70 family RNA polymerase sigma factor [Geodermatophilus pulveris]SNS36765.1 RNA polymerase sigma-70 factor, ECF subfamily [Geodermatophilus pulveris]
MDLGRSGPGGPAAALAAALPRGGGGVLAGRTRRADGAAGRAVAVRPDLEQVFRADYRWVVATAARVLGSRDEAEDVAQEVFLAFSRTTVPAGEARGWLSVAAVHTALNVLRSGRRRATREAATAVDEPAADVADTVVGRDEHSRLRALLVRLPHKQSAALVLRHSGLSYAEIAEALDMAPGSVGTTIRRAESALREEWVRHASSE